MATCAPLKQHTTKCVEFLAPLRKPCLSRPRPGSPGRTDAERSDFRRRPGPGNWTSAQKSDAETKKGWKKRRRTKQQYVELKETKDAEIKARRNKSFVEATNLWLSVLGPEVGRSAAAGGRAQLARPELEPVDINLSLSLSLSLYIYIYTYIHYCTVLYYTILYYTILYYTILY